MAWTGQLHWWLMQLDHFLRCAVRTVTFCLRGQSRIAPKDRRLIIWAPLPAPKEPIHSWMAHLTLSPGEGNRAHVTSHIKALGDALFVCMRGILSCLLCGSHSIDTAAGCHCAYAGWVFQVKLSFDLRGKWEWQRPGSAPGAGPLCCIKPSWSSKASSHNEPCHRFHCANIPTSPQHRVHIDCRLWVRVCACT